MTRTKCKARRQASASTDDDADDVMVEEYEVEDQKRPLESDGEIEIIGNLEEVDYVVSAVMQVECKEQTLAQNSASDNLDNCSADPFRFSRAAAEEELEPVLQIVESDVQTTAEQTFLENSESDNLDNSSANASRSNREAAEQELEPPANEVRLKQNLMNGEFPSTESKDEEEGEVQEMLEEMKGDDCESDERSKDSVVNELPLISVENQESQVDRRNKLSLQVRTIFIEAAPKSWNADKLRDFCEQFGEIKNVEISRNLNRKGQDFGFVAFTTREYALACVEGINGREFEENCKVKAYIARPLNRKWFPKVIHGGFKRKHKHKAGLKTAKTHRTELLQKVNVAERQMRIALLAHEAEEKATSLLDKTGQEVPNILGTRESETQNYEGDIPLAAEVGMPSRRRKNRKRKQRNRGRDMRALKEHNGHDVPSILGTRESEMQNYEGDIPLAAEVGMPSSQRKNRKRKRRNRGQNMRASKEQKGYSQEQTGVSSTEPRNKSQSRKRQKFAVVSTSIGPKPKGSIARQVHIPVHRSKNIHPELEPHARYIKIDGQHNAAGERVPAFRGRQPHGVHAHLAVHKGGQPRPRSSFRKNFTGNDALPHAGYIELVGKHHFSNHLVRRHAAHDGRGNHGFAYTGRM